MRAAILFMIMSFAVYAAAQAKGGTSSGATTGGSGLSTSGGSTGGAATATPNVSPGMTGQPTTGPASVAPTTNLGPSSTQPSGTSAVQTGTTGANVTGTTTNTGGFITNAPIGTAGNNNGVTNTGPSGNSGYVPLLQTPTASFPSPLNADLPVSPAGISNSPSALVYSNLPTGGRMDIPPASTGVEPSLGEVAREYRSRGQQQQASRVYTNADIANLDRQQPGSSIGPQGNTSTQGGNMANQSPTTPSVGNGQPPNTSLPASDNTTPQTPRR